MILVFNKGDYNHIKPNRYHNQIPITVMASATVAIEINGDYFIIVKDRYHGYTNEITPIEELPDLVKYYTVEWLRSLADISLDGDK